MKNYLIGYPLGYSCSPKIHHLFNHHAKYEQLVLKEEQIEPFLKERNFSLVNVTIPYKKTIIKYLDEIDEASREIGAVNTIIKRNNKLIGYNTDFYGVQKAFEINKVKIKNKIVMILGTGGTYQTISYLCKLLSAKEIIGVSRTKKENYLTYEEALQRRDIDILINTTPVGTFPRVDELIIDLSNFTKLECILDMTYNPLQSELLKQGRKLNIKCINGLIPLVYQAGKSEEILLKRSIPSSTYLKIYKQMVKENTSICLIGMPGVGKTKIGKLLAERLDYQFIDTDLEIEKRENLTVAEIFKKYGEEYFRNKELELIKEISLNKKMVISTGGGMIENPQIMSYLQYNCRIIHLTRKMDRNLFDGRRPKLKTIDDYLSLKERRYPLYRKYQDFTFNNNSKVDVIVERIIKKL